MSNPNLETISPDPTITKDTVSAVPESLEVGIDGKPIMAADVKKNWLSYLNFAKWTKLTLDAIKAGTIAVPWGGISGKPNSFPPSGHQHATGDITGLQNFVDTRVGVLAPASHQHVAADITDFTTAVDARVSQGTVSPSNAYVRGDGKERTTRVDNLNNDLPSGFYFIELAAGTLQANQVGVPYIGKWHVQHTRGLVTPDANTFTQIAINPSNGETFFRYRSHTMLSPSAWQFVRTLPTNFAAYRGFNDSFNTYTVSTLNQDLPAGSYIVDSNTTNNSAPGTPETNKGFYTVQVNGLGMSYAYNANTTVAVRQTQMAHHCSTGRLYIRRGWDQQTLNGGWENWNEIRYVVARGGNNTVGWELYSDDYLKMWGLESNKTAEGMYAVTFPAARQNMVPNSFFFTPRVSVTPYRNPGGSGSTQAWVQAANVSSTGFSWVLQAMGQAGPFNMGCSWTAEGY